MGSGTKSKSESRWKKLRRDKRAVLGALHKIARAETVDAGKHPTLPRLELRENPRKMLVGVELVDGSLVAVDRSRPMSWEWSVQKEQGRLASCESTVVCGWDSTDEKYLPVALRCGSRLCPVCYAARAGRAVHKWGPIVDRALEQGAQVWHLTLTQRADEQFGGAVMAHERTRWIGPQPQPGEVLPAFGGECAMEAYERWRGTWRTIRTSRYGRGLWVNVGALTGVEWTFRRTGRDAPPQQVPRCHCHGHVLLVVDAEKEPGWTPRAIMLEWARVAGVDGEELLPWVRRPFWTEGTSKRGNPWMRFGQQFAERVTDRSGLLEVLKYPFKPSDVTVAGMADVWGALRGTRTHQVSGPLHHQCKRATAEPWRTWLDAREEVAPIGVVHWRAEPGWAVVTHRTIALPHEVELRVRTGTDPDGSPTWRYWSGHLGPLVAVAGAHPVCSAGGDEEHLVT